MLEEGKIEVFPKSEKESCPDRFYCEANVKAILEAKSQLERGEGIKFDINAFYEEV